MPRCYCAPTPYSILNRDTDPYDIFEKIIPETDKYAEEKRLALWDRFHDTGLGNDNETYWIRCMKARADEIDGRYEVKFRVWSEYQARLATLAAQKKEIDLSDGKIESNSVNRTYDPPEVAVQGAVADDYLADQNKTDYEQKTYGGLEPDTVGKYMDAVNDPFESWTREFDKLFYWGL